MRFEVFMAENDDDDLRTVSIFKAEDGQNVSPKCWHLPVSLYGAKTQKNNTINVNIIQNQVGNYYIISSTSCRRRIPSRN
jgi:hypothetical protein